MCNCPASVTEDDFRLMLPDEIMQFEPQKYLVEEDFSGNYVSDACKGGKERLDKDKGS